MKKQYAKRRLPDGRVQRIGSIIADPTTYNTLRNLQAPIDEIDALACLLAIANKADQKAIVRNSLLHGYDMEGLYEIVVRRIRKLARACQDMHVRWRMDSPAEPAVMFVPPDDAP